MVGAGLRTAGVAGSAWTGKAVSWLCVVSGVCMALAATLALTVSTDQAEAARFAKPSDFNSGAIVNVDRIKGWTGSKVNIGTRWEKGKTWNYAKLPAGVGGTYFEARTKRRYGRIQGKLAKLGRMDLKFKPEVQKRVTFRIQHSRCREGKRVRGIVQGGYLAGSIALQNEQNYFQYRVRDFEVWANRQLVNLPKCAFRKERARPAPRTGLRFTARRKNLFAWFFTSSTVDGHKARFVAQMKKRYGKTLILRESIGTAEVRFNKPVPGRSEVHVGGGGFSGRAIVAYAPNAEKRWTGTQRWNGRVVVNFAGKRNVRLITPRTKIRLVSLDSPPSPTSAPPAIVATPSSIILEPRE